MFKQIILSDLLIGSVCGKSASSWSLFSIKCYINMINATLYCLVHQATLPAIMLLFSFMPERMMVYCVLRSSKWCDNILPRGVSLILRCQVMLRPILWSMHVTSSTLGLNMTKILPAWSRGDRKNIKRKNLRHQLTWKIRHQLTWKKLHQLTWKNTSSTNMEKYFIN